MACDGRFYTRNRRRALPDSRGNLVPRQVRVLCEQQVRRPRGKKRLQAGWLNQKGGHWYWMVVLQSPSAQQQQRIVNTGRGGTVA